MAGSGGRIWRRLLFGGFVALTVVSLGLGYWGLLLKAGDSRAYRTDWWDLVYWDLQLFVLDSAPAQDGGSMPWPLQVARFTAPAATAYALARAAYALLERRIGRWQAQRAKGHVIVCGSEPPAAVLARELLAKREKVVIVASGADDPVAPRAGGGAEGAPPGARLVVGDAREEDVLRRAGLAKARDVMVVTSDSAFNAEVALVVRALAEREGLAVGCHAEIADRQVCAALVARSRVVHGSRLHFFSRHDRTATELVEQSPVLSGDLDDPAAAAALIVGGGQLAQAVLLEIGRLWDQRAQVWRHQGRGRAALPVRVVDPTGELAAQLPRLPLPSDALELDVVTGGLTSLSGTDDLQVPIPGDPPDPPRRCDPAHVFVCPEDDLAALRFSLVATELLPRARVVAAVTSGTVFGELLGGGEAAVRGAGGRLVLHNVIRTVYASRSVRRDHIEDMARAAHQAYVAAEAAKGRTPGDNASMVPWDELPEELRESNRNQVRDVDRKLAAIGCAVGPTTTGFTFTDDEVELLARMEHDRWMASLLDGGWALGPEKDPARKTHPNLVPWEELDEQDREKDRVAVRAIPGFFTGGLGIVRRPGG